MTVQESGGNWGRVLSLWGASFGVIGMLLFFYGGVPLFPILLAGAFTLAFTVFKIMRSAARKP